MLPMLVRDGTPKRLRESGKVVQVMYVGPNGGPALVEISRVKWLQMKLDDELRDFSKNLDPNELIDIYEVLRGLWATCNPGEHISLSNAAAMKRDKVGGYDNFTLLTSVSESAP